MKRIAAIHDLSCFGRGSLTTVIPVLSGMGVQVCPLPTALLSTHTGGFDNFTFLDLTSNMEQVMDHWKRLGLTFDGIYSGFLGCPAQIDLVERFIADWKREDTLVCIDPVMGDNGQMYEVYTDEMAKGMRRMIRHAHVITPNLTEAYLLAQMAYDPAPTKDVLTEMAKSIFALGPANIVITGVVRGDEVDTVVFPDRQAKAPFALSSRRTQKDYPGCGDLFTSVMVGKMIQGGTLLEGVEKGVRFAAEVIEQTAFHKTPPREGLAFEESFKKLIKEGDRIL